MYLCIAQLYYMLDNVLKAIYLFATFLHRTFRVWALHGCTVSVLLSGNHVRPHEGNLEEALARHTAMNHYALWNVADASQRCQEECFKLANKKHTSLLTISIIYICIYIYTFDVRRRSKSKALSWLMINALTVATRWCGCMRHFWRWSVFGMGHDRVQSLGGEIQHVIIHDVFRKSDRTKATQGKTPVLFVNICEHSCCSISKLAAEQTIERG